MPPVPSQPSQLLASLAGTSAFRHLVNLGFHLDAKIRVDTLRRADPVAIQERQLSSLIRKASATRFGRDHHFDRVRTVADFQKAVPLRTYESLWNDYLRDHYPIFDNLTWPGRIPFLALTSGTTQGATKYLPVSRDMVASNRKAGTTLLAHYLHGNPRSRLFHGRIFFLGGSTNLESPAPGVQEGDLSGVAAIELAPFLRPYTFPPLDIALESDWDRKLERLCLASLDEKITFVGGVPSWLLTLFERLLARSGKSTIAEVWPSLEVVCHGGVKFDPYRAAFDAILGSPNIRLIESYPCSEGFIGFGDPATGLLRLLFDHGIFYEFVPADELESLSPTRHWMGTVQTGVNYAIVVSTCAGMWSHIIGDTVRYTSLDPPLFTFTGRTKYTLSAFGEHLISEEVEAAIATAAARTGASIRDWHVGPVFQGALGYHQFVVEFLENPSDMDRFRDTLDADLRERNADYQAHRAPGVGLPAPALLVTKPGVFDQWMRRRGKLGGQNKVPRMDNSGILTADITDFIRQTDGTAAEILPRP